MKVLITGANGFIGRSLTAHLRTRGDCDLRLFDVGNSMEYLRQALNDADVVYHLAGVNRPETADEFETGNTDLTRKVCDILRDMRRKPKVVFSSSVQATLENAYGISKRRAEEALEAFGAHSHAVVRIHRLTNVFGKWSRPNYNSVVATFCYNIANDLPISISDPSRQIELVYIDDVVDAFVAELSEKCPPVVNLPAYTIALADLAGRIQAFHDMQTNLLMPDFAVRFNRQLYTTYLSYLPDERRRQQLQVRTDERGRLAEFIKSRHFGQIFISRTKPGVTRGNHYHHTKAEKFFVVEGEATIRMRHIESSDVVEYRLMGTDFQVVDIPPGYTHSIENIGAGEMVTLFWASDIFDPDRPDTFFLPVLPPVGSPVPLTT